MDKVALTYEKFNDLCKNIAAYFTAKSEDYSTCAKDAEACLDAIETCQTQEETNPENAPANRERLTATFAKYEFEVEPLTPNCDLAPIQRDFKIKFDFFSQFHTENHAVAKALTKLPKLAIIFNTLINDGITCSSPKLAPSAIFNDVISRAQRQLNDVENPPKDPQQNFLVLFMLPIADAQEICKTIAKLEQWILANIFTLAHRNNSFVPSIDTTNSEMLKILKRMEMRQVEQENTINRIKNNSGLMQVEVTNMHQESKNFQYNANGRLKNIENQTAFVAANMPPSEQTAAVIDAAKREAQRLVSDDDALIIMKAICREYAATSRQTLTNWRNAGYEPKTGKIITDAAFASLQSWVIWCQEFYTEMEKRAQIKQSIQKCTKTNPPRPEKRQ